MANKKMKTNLDYYARQANTYQNSKFKLLRHKMGFDYEARFWILNDMIAESDNCILDLTKIHKKIDILEILKLTEEEMKVFIDFLKSEDCRLLIEIDPEKYTTERVQEQLKEVMEDRERARHKKGFQSSRELSQSSEELKESSEEQSQNSPEKTQNSGYKVKETKLKESKVNTLDYFENIARQKIPEKYLDKWRLWIESCAEKNEPVTRTEAVIQLSQLRESSIDVDIGKIIEETIKARHKGFTFIIEKLIKEKDGTNIKQAHKGATDDELARITTDRFIRNGK